MTNAYADVSLFPRTAKPLTSYRPYWAKRFGSAPFLPMSREEMQQLGWDSCDIIIISGDAYVDHPSFGPAILCRLLEKHGYKVGIIPQPDWHSTRDFDRLGKPRLGFLVSAGNMDSLLNKFTAAKKMRHQDAAQRPRQVPGDEDPEALQQTQPLRHLGREEQLAQGQREEQIGRAHV